MLTKQEIYANDVFTAVSEINRLGAYWPTVFQCRTANVASFVSEEATESNNLFICVIPFESLLTGLLVSRSKGIFTNSFTFYIFNAGTPPIDSGYNKSAPNLGSNGHERSVQLGDLRPHHHEFGRCRYGASGLFSPVMAVGLGVFNMGWHLLFYRVI